jgi:hypothetical protein
VKLTAQFVARNGRQFLSTLMTREQRNYQFDFLRPQHSLFQYFTKLLEQYTKVLIPPKDVVKNLALETRKLVLDDVKYRTNWIKHQEVQRRKVEEEAERERSMSISTLVPTYVMEISNPRSDQHFELQLRFSIACKLMHTILFLYLQWRMQVLTGTTL